MIWASTRAGLSAALLQRRPQLGTELLLVFCLPGPPSRYGPPGALHTPGPAVGADSNGEEHSVLDSRTNLHLLTASQMSQIQGGPGGAAMAISCPRSWTAQVTTASQLVREEPGDMWQCHAWQFPMRLAGAESCGGVQPHLQAGPESHRQKHLLVVLLSPTTMFYDVLSLGEKENSSSCGLLPAAGSPSC